MPESVTDRPTKSHEYLFLLSKRERYYYDGGAIREDVKTGSSRPLRAPKYGANRINGTQEITEKTFDEVKGANKRSVWTVPLRPFPGAHFATFPPDLIEPCIKAGSSERGCCGACGAPWVRIISSGWKPSCKCPEADPVPCVVLDPFNGAGTTPLVSLALGRRAIGFDLSPKYLRMARRRIERPHAKPERPARDESLPLFGVID
jgi:DNA modification methylase